MRWNFAGSSWFKLADYQYFIMLFLVSALIYTLGISRVKSIIWGDSLYYYAYTKSLVLDGDIDFSNEAFHSELGFPNTVEFSLKTGKITNKFSPGTALFWIPGMVMGQFVSYVANFFAGHEVLVVDGTGVVPQFFVALSSILFSTIGMWFVYQTLAAWFGKKIAALSAIFILFSTQLFYYTALDPVNSHSVSFLLSSVLLYQASLSMKTGVNWKKAMVMGVTAGLLMLVRNQDVVVALPIVLATLYAQKESLLQRLNTAILIAGSAFVVFAVQIYTTITLFGVLNSPYLIRNEPFYWFKPDFFRVLFTSENGLFFFAPLLLFALLFLTTSAVTKKKNQHFRILAFSAIASFLLQIYMVASWGAEIVGGPYGSRMFVSVLPQLSIGIALSLQFLQRKFQKSFLILCASLLVLFFFNMIIQTVVMLIHF